MPWLGVKDTVDEDEFRKFVEEKLHLRILKSRKVKIKTRRGWLSFIVVDVLGFAEGYAYYIVERFGVASLEGGEHLILGEPSAKLWDEAVKIVFPDNTEEIVPVYTFDGFLDIRLPTDNVEGLEGYITVAGATYTLPLSFDDLIEIYQRGKIEKVEKAVSIYGMEKVLARDAISKLSQLRKRKVRVEIDYESGFVFIMRDKEIITKSIPDYVAELIQDGEFDKVSDIYGKCSPEIREGIKKKILELYHILEEIGKKEQAEKIKIFLKNKIVDAQS